MSTFNKDGIIRRDEIVDESEKEFAGERFHLLDGLGGAGRVHPRHERLVEGLFLQALSPLPQVGAARPVGKPLFEDDILPFFKRRCGTCHSGARSKAGLDLMSRSGILRGGKSGAAIRLRAAGSSLLWGKLASGKMPPKGPQLTRKQKGLVRVWINEGALGREAAREALEQAADVQLSEEDREYWAFRAPRRPPVPALSATRRPKTRSICSSAGIE